MTWRRNRRALKVWGQGQTGFPIVDAGMRELEQTGYMHNRARMLVASYLTKHLMTDWRVGERWFADCLIDWDPASNALGWQWTAGSGPAAARVELLEAGHAAGRGLEQMIGEHLERAHDLTFLRRAVLARRSSFIWGSVTCVANKRMKSNM